MSRSSEVQGQNDVCQKVLTSIHVVCFWLKSIVTCCMYL